jgi:GTP-binding protein
MRIFDTAGMRKKAKVQEKLEKLSVADGLRAVKFAEVVVVLLDAAIPFESRTCASPTWPSARAAPWWWRSTNGTWRTEKQEKLRAISARRSRRLLPQLRGAPLVTVSAQDGRGLDRLHAAILKAHEVWNRRVPTAALNRWLAAMTEAHPPPAPGGRRIKLRYMTQAKTRPPGFVVMCSHPDKVPASYTRYLVNGLREDFDMPGTPIRLWLRSQADKNPYKDRKKSTPSRLSKHVRSRDPAAARPPHRSAHRAGARRTRCPGDAALRALRGR